MATRTRLAFVSALLVAAMVGCDKSPTSPSRPSLTGTWVGGNFFQACSGATCQPTGTLTLQLTQSGSTLTGTWTSTQMLGAGPGGTMSGSMNGSSVSMTFTLDVVTPDCSFPIRVTATVNANQDQMTGTYATVSCSFLLTGSISLTKQ